MTVIAYTSAAPSPKVSQSDATVGQAVLPQNIQLYGAGDDTADPLATFTYLWSIISAPPGSTASLSSSTAQNPTLNGVNVWGNYILMLVVTSSTSGASESNPLQAPDTARVGVRVTSASAGLEKTAIGERNWFTPGYWPVVDKVEQHDQILNTLTASVQAGGTLTVQAATNLAAGDVVYPSDIALLGTETILVVSKAPASNALVLTSQLLVMEEIVLSGATGNARWFGLSPVSGSGSPAVLDPVYVSDTATLSLTPGTNQRQVGQVVEASGGLYRTLVLAGSTGGGSTTAQVLLQAADGAFPAGIDISALTAPVEFSDVVGFASSSFGVPLVARFIKATAAAVADRVMAVSAVMKNSLGTPKAAGGLAFRWVNPTAGSEEAEADVMVTGSSGFLETAATFARNVLKVVDMSGGAAAAEVTSDAPLKVHTASGYLLLEGSSVLIGRVNGVEGWRLAYDTGNADFVSPAGSTGENRLVRRRHLTTVNAAPAVIDNGPLFSGTDVYAVSMETTVGGMDAGLSKYIYAKRVARFVYDGGSVVWTAIGSTYVPVPDDTTGGTLAVEVNLSGGTLNVQVTGDASTTIEWTSWTQFLITKIG